MPLQDSIHKLEEGGGLRFVRPVLAVLAVILLAVAYNWRAYRAMGTQEAMDAAQVGRNLSQGKGFSTLCIRPFSIFLLKRHASQTGNTAPDPGRLKSPHPDLANAPVYPTVLAGLMKVLPFQYQLPTKPSPFWGTGDSFKKYQPDFLIAIVNQALFCLTALLVFRLARRLFDPPVAWLSVVLVLSTEVFWRFATSGLSTILVLFEFIALIWILVLVEEEGRNPRRGLAGQMGLALAAGLLVGLGALTRYAFGWLILPVLLFLFLFAGPRRAAISLVALLVFAAILAPWIGRNYALSGAPFGTAGYCVFELTGPFSEHRLMRSLDPEFSRLSLTPFWAKLLINSRQILTLDLPRLGGTWMTGFFLAGLLIQFRNPTIARLRYFLLFCIPILVIVQALGRTQLSEDSPEINSENLLVLLYPALCVYGASLFFLLLDRLTLPARVLRYLIVGGFGLLASLAMIFTLLPPRQTPFAYPPYFPPYILRVSGWVKEKELAMSDVPWAMAWYGHRQTLWLTLTVQGDFFAIHDYQKPVALAYITTVTLNSGFQSHWLRSADSTWEKLIVRGIGGRDLPPSFPLNKLLTGWWPDQLVLADSERWTVPPSGP